MYWPPEGCITMRYDKPTGDCCLCKKCCLGEEWSIDIAVSRTLATHSGIQSENTRLETLWFSPLTRISSDVADRSLLLYCILGVWAFCQVVLLFEVHSCLQDMKWLWIGPMAYHPLTRFHYSKIVKCVMIMAALALFQAWIWVAGGLGKFLSDLGGRNIFDTKRTWSGSMLASGWLYVLLHYYNGCIVVMDWIVHIVKLELSDT